MKSLEFEWDAKKDQSNTKKHGVSFEEARTAFYDEYAIQFFDPEHSENEDRFLLLGSSFKSTTTRRAGGMMKAPGRGYCYH